MPTEQTVTYRRIGGQELQMEVFRSDSSAGPRPGVLFIHGGGWNGGKRSTFHWHARELARRGYVTASASYRLASVALDPAALDDCQCAMRWLRKHAGELGLAPDRLGVFGSSAGGHLVACLGVRDTREDVEPDLQGFSSRAQCVVDVHGVHDLAAMKGHRTETSLVRFLGGTLEEKPEAWRDASPIHFVSSADAPFLLIHDPKDPTVPYDQSVRMAGALMQAGCPVEFQPSLGSGHGFVYDPEKPWTRRVWPVACAWLDRWLNGPAE